MLSYVIDRAGGGGRSGQPPPPHGFATDVCKELTPTRMHACTHTLAFFMVIPSNS